MKRRVLMSMLLLALAAALIAGGTMAWFTDRASGTGNLEPAPLILKPMDLRIKHRVLTQATGTRETAVL